MINTGKEKEFIMDLLKIIEFVKPFYEKKDIMHNLDHIERVLKYVDKLINIRLDVIDKEIVTYAAYFHGFIYSYENIIRGWLKSQNISEDCISKIVKVAWESQKKEEAETLEGRILHDAHMIEGGRTYLIVKSLITGSVRGQTLEQTIDYIENNILDKGLCYLPEAQEIYDEQQAFAKDFIVSLKEGLDIENSI